MNHAGDIKRVKGEPSLVAISKVLHFYNPRLFMIVDRGMVWNWLFAHGWIWNQVLAERQAVDELLHGGAQKRDDYACDPTSYVAVLLWAADLVRANPQLMPQFTRFLRAQCNPFSVLPEDLDSYESVAAEWVLLGLVELPPEGVHLPA